MKKGGRSLPPERKILLRTYRETAVLSIDFPAAAGGKPMAE
jgi:hypothetical protein